MTTGAPFRAFRVSEENGGVQGRIVQTTLDELSPGDVVICAAYSSVNYKDALAATGAGKIMRRLLRSLAKAHDVPQWRILHEAIQAYGTR